MSSYLDFISIQSMVLALKLICADFMVLAIGYWFKKRLMTTLGISLTDQAVIAGLRSTMSLPELLKKYSETKFKWIDMSARKIFLHLSIGVVVLFLLAEFKTDPYTQAAAFFIYITYKVVLNVIFFGSGGLLGRIIYMGARIRDGKYGRKNLLIAMILGCIFFALNAIVLLSLFSKKVITIAEVFLWYNLSAMPYIIGDACGEIFGSTFGKQRIAVLGVGEINKKSRLGVFSVFLGSLISMLGFSWVNAYLSLGLAGVITLTAVVACIVELVSPRSTDNLTVPLVSFLIIGVYILV